MKPGRVDVFIDELVVHRGAGCDPRQLGAALQQELVRRLSGQPAGRAGGVAVPIAQAIAGRIAASADGGRKDSQ